MVGKIIWGVVCKYLNSLGIPFDCNNSKGERILVSFGVGGEGGFGGVGGCFIMDI